MERLLQDYKLMLTSRSKTEEGESSFFSPKKEPVGIMKITKNQIISLNTCHSLSLNCHVFISLTSNWVSWPSYPTVAVQHSELCPWGGTVLTPNLCYTACRGTATVPLPHAWRPSWLDYLLSWLHECEGQRGAMGCWNDALLSDARVRLWRLMKYLIFFFLNQWCKLRLLSIFYNRMTN